MGGTTSQFQHIDNDFELVIRATKALDKALTDLMPQHYLSRDSSLADKLQNCPGLSSRSRELAKRLNQCRNKIAHDHDCNSLRDLDMTRGEFNYYFEEVSVELDQLWLNKNKQMGRDSYAHGTMIVPAQKVEDDFGTPGGAMLAGAGLFLGAVALAAAASGNSREEEERKKRNHNSSWF